jgi:uncharacterized membrane protein
MASSKSKARVAAQQRARAQAKKAAARTAPPAVRATPTSSAATRTVRAAAATAAAEANLETLTEPEESQTPAGPPLWFTVTTLVLAVIGLGISAYETYAHFNGSHLLGCAGGAHATFNCTAVITSSQSMVFGVIPVAILGLAFYVVAVPLFSPWGWRFTGFRIGRLGLTQRHVGWFRLGSVVVGMGFVMYLIYAEFQIGDICEYCTGVHIVTFLLFCMTVMAAAIWGLGEAASRPASR